MPISDPIISNVLNQDLRPAAEKLQAIRAAIPALKAEIAALQAHVVAQAYSLSEEIADGRDQLPVTFNDIIVMRDLVTALDAVLAGTVPGSVPNAATVATALALIGIQSRVW